MIKNNIPFSSYYFYLLLVAFEILSNTKTQILRKQSLLSVYWTFSLAIAGLQINKNVFFFRLKH